MILVDASLLLHAGLREYEPVFVPNPGPRHAAILDRLVLQNCQQHRDVPDAHIAALAIEHGLVLATHDRGFSRFDGLRWDLPLAN